MILSTILAEHGLNTHTFAADVGGTAKKASPRDLVIKLIDNSIKLFGNPEYKIKNAKGKLVTPECCFKVNGDEAELWLAYAKQRLTLEGNDRVIQVNKNLVLKYLNALKVAVDRGIYDAQLDSIKSARATSHKKGASKNA